MIDLDKVDGLEIYVDDWQAVIKELKAAREVVALARAKPTLCSERLFNLGIAIEKYDEVTGEG